jgi:hypothetical protein
MMNNKDSKKLYPRVRRSFALAALCCVPVATVIPNSSFAQAWQFDPIVQLGYEIDDNATLSIRTDEEVRISGFQGDVSARVDYTTSTTNFMIVPRVRLRRYDESDFDSTDEFVRMNLSHSTRLNTFGIRGFYDNESIRTAERADIDPDVDNPDDIPIDDTGRVGVQGDRTRVRARPYWEFRLSNLTSIQASMDYTVVTYDQELVNISDVLIDYEDARADLSFNRRFSDLTSGILMLSARSITNDFGVNEVDTYGGMLGFNRDLTEKVSLRALIGMESVEFLSGGDNEPVMVGELRLVRNLETITFLAQYRRAVTSGGNAIPSIRDDISLNFVRQLSEKISASLGARVYHSERIDATNDQGRDYLRIGAGIGWNLTRSFKLQLNFRHTIIDRGGVVGERADGNQGILWFIYRPNAGTVL